MTDGSVFRLPVGVMRKYVIGGMTVADLELGRALDAVGRVWWSEQEIRQAQLDAIEDSARVVEAAEGPITTEVVAGMIRRLKEKV